MAPQRQLFNGLAQLIVQSTGRPGAITIDAFAASGEGPRLVPASLRLTTTLANA